MNRQATTDSFWIKAERPLDEHSAVIRRQAEEQLRKSTADVSGMPSENIQKLVYELQVHQIELELQNEELKRTQQELMISRERYVKLYNSGTIGYLTLSREGVILHANHAAEELLNCPKEKLINTRLGRFIHPSDQDTYYRFIKNFTAQPTQKSQVFRLNTVKEADNNPPCLGYKLTHCTKEDCNNNNNNNIYIECHHAVNNDD
ncbi:MAG: PAS domain-containing protein [Methylococcales bacterium]|nr:PAS domain-containing protein [Methylococcales bacterium]